jgi:hypothetical protein
MIRGYAGRAAVAAGNTLDLHVATDAPYFQIVAYLLGDGLRPVGESPWFRGADAPAGAPDTAWNWPRVGWRVPAEWPSGVYRAELIEGDAPCQARTRPDLSCVDGRAPIIYFVVRPPSPSCRILYKLPTNTHNAYTKSGGGSYYWQPRASVSPPGSKVTFHRPDIGNMPYGHYPPLPTEIDPYDRSSPREGIPHWDAKVIRWLVQQQIEVDYCTDLDLHEEPEILLPYRLLLCAGHDEYWSAAMRDHVEAFVGTGGNVAFFSGNTCWWHIRYVDGNTAMVCDNHLAGNTDRWWLTRPENALTGVSYRNGGGWWHGEREHRGYTVWRPDHWCFAGTDLAQGEEFGAALPEATGVDGSPRNLTILATGTLSDQWQDLPERETTGPHIATMVISEGRGTVFNAATTDWPRLLTDRIVSRITRNVVLRLSGQSA